MVCILFRSYLILAVAGVSKDAFTVVACIGLDGMKLEAPDNCKGMSALFRIRDFTAPTDQRLA